MYNVIMNKKILILLLLVNLVIGTNKIYACTFPNPPVTGEFIGDIIAKKIHSAIANLRHNRQLKINRKENTVTTISPKQPK